MRRLLRFIALTVLWAFAFIGGIFVLLVIAGLFIAGNLPLHKPSIPQQAWLNADLSESVLEIDSSAPWSAYLAQGPRMEDFIFGLQDAARDERIKGLYIRLNSAYMGASTAQEIHETILAFRKSGKPVYIFSENFDSSNSGMWNYYLASAGTRIFLQPSGNLGLVGFGIEQPFLREGLDKIGIEAQMDGRKDFKGALFSLTKNNMPDSVRQNLRQLTDDWLNQSLNGIALARAIPLSTVQSAFAQAPLTAAEARDAGLVDDADYHDNALRYFLAQAALPEAAGIDLVDYTNALKRDGKGANNIAVIPVTGEIISGESEGEGRAGADTFTRALNEAMEDGVKAIILRINSPGGSYIAADRMWHDVGQARAQGIPVLVSMSDFAASGGYFLTLKADRIFAEPGSLVGSIGVFGGKFVLSGLWEKLGISVDAVASGDKALMESPHRSYSPGEWRELEESLDRIYADFTAKVAAGRNMPMDKVEALAQGQVYSGARARELGLVDDVGGMLRAIEAARSEANIPEGEEISLAYYPSEEERVGLLLRKLMRRFQGRENLWTLLWEEFAIRHQELRLPLWLPVKP